MPTIPESNPVEPHVPVVNIDDLDEVQVAEVPVEPEKIDLPPELPPSTAPSVKEQLIKQVKEKAAKILPKPASEPVQPLPEVAQPVEQKVVPEVEGPKPHKGAVRKTTSLEPPAASTATVVASVKSETRKEIESILQAGLAEMYVKMTPQEQQVFSAAANETAGKLETLMTQFRASAREVLRLIRLWLSKIPRVNKFFLEQASKIKTDEIIHLQMERKKQARLIR